MWPVAGGAAGHPTTAPFDRVLATATVRLGELPYAWVEQTTPGGWIVVPVRTEITSGPLVAFTVQSDGTASGRAVPLSVGFMELRAQRIPLGNLKCLRWDDPDAGPTPPTWRRRIPRSTGSDRTHRGRERLRRAAYTTRIADRGKEMSLGLDGYEYDIFISYRRAPNVQAWVQNHFYPVLRDCLTDEISDEPKIFLDAQQEVGVRWPDNLARALHRSRLLVAVWSPPYFRSSWCLAEWHTMLQRERLLGIGGPADPMGLVYPVRYSDGDRFPEEARSVEQQVSFTDWRYPYRQFSESLAYLEFHTAVVKMAEYLAGRLDNVPQWQADWPVVRPGSPEPSPAALPRL